MLPQYNTVLFNDIWSSDTEFKTDLATAPTLTNVITSDNQSILFYLLYARYGNSPIANLDLNQFKYKIYSIIFQYGGTWQKKLQIQDRLKELTSAEITQGTKVINNHAMNPATDPSTGELSELEYIDAQNTTNYKKGEVEAYGQLWSMLDDNITELFIDRFSICFKKFVKPDITDIYLSNEEEDDSDVNS